MRASIVVSLLLGAAVFVASFFVGKHGMNIAGIVIGAICVVAVLAMIPSLRRRQKI
jgi:VIT1/CCC1 family predicted Fe2+/Mn2+ transporter